MGNFLGSLLSAVGSAFLGPVVGPAVGGMFSGSGRSTSGAFGPPPDGGGLVPGSDFGHSVGANVGDAAAAASNPLATSLGGLLGTALYGRVNARLSGVNQRAYNKAAYPGAAPWEMIGSGSAGAAAGAMASPELLMQDKISRRQASVELQTARIGATSSLAGKMLDAGADPKDIQSLLSAGGLIAPGQGVDPFAVYGPRGRAEVDRLRYETSDLLPSQTASNLASADSSSASADRTRVDTALEPWRFALQEWTARFGHSYTANEIAGIGNLIDSSVSDFLGDPSAAAGPFAARLLSRLDHFGVGTDDAEALVRSLMDSFKP